MVAQAVNNMRPIEIGLFWHSYRSGNLGVGALSIANAHLIREAAAELGIPVTLTIFGMRENNPDYPVGEAITNIDLDFAYILSPAGLLRDVKALDLAIDIGAGDSFADIYSTKRVIMVVLTKLAARLRHIPLILAPQTIGPFNQPFWKKMAARSLGWAETILTRDTRSTEAARALAPGAHIVEAVDVAFALPFERRPSTASNLQIGLNVSGLLWSGGPNGDNAFGLGYDYRDLVRGFIRHAEALGATVHLIPHVIAPHLPRDDDTTAIDAVAAEFPSAVRVTPFSSPIAAKSYISSLDFLAAARMHAAIAALSSGVPVLPISYSRKFEGLFGTLGYDWLVPHKGMNTEEALKLADRALANRAAMKADVDKANSRVKERLDRYRAILKTTLAAAADTRKAESRR